MNAIAVNATVSTLRLLQSDTNQSRGRTVLTILYLIVLGFCFFVPVFYYFRLHCEDRETREMRELELRHIQEAYANSVTMGRDETRATRRKYKDERRARLLQLFGPVSVVLSKEHFPHLQILGGGLSHAARGETKQDEEEFVMGPPVDPIENASYVVAPVDPELGNASFNDDSETVRVVRLPVPGMLPSLPLQLREVPNDCAICISHFRVGDDVVWSSNPLCEHCFHANCIETWLMKQRGGPLCPCCRRDFVIDPLDEDDGNENMVVGNETDITTTGSDDYTGAPRSVPSVHGARMEP